MTRAKEPAVALADVDIPQPVAACVTWPYEFVLLGADRGATGSDQSDGNRRLLVHS